MGLFKGLNDKPYTKADYYRDMEERAAAKLAAKADHVILLVATKEPEWLSAEATEEASTQLKSVENVEKVIVAFEESSTTPDNSIIGVENTSTATEVIMDSITDTASTTGTTDTASADAEKPKKVVKNKRKKPG